MLCTYGFVDDVVFYIMDHVSCGVGIVDVGAVLQQVAQRIRQGEPRRLTVVVYMSSNCAPSSKVNRSKFKRRVGKNVIDILSAANVVID